MTKQNPDIHALSARIPKPLYSAVASVSAITGESVNQLIVKGLETVVENFNATSDQTSATVSVPNLGMVRQSYASTPQWSQPRREGLASLSKWTSTEEEKD